MTEINGENTKAINLLREYRSHLGGAYWSLDEDEQGKADEIAEAISELKLSCQTQSESSAEPLAYAVLSQGGIIDVQEDSGEAEYLAWLEGAKVIPLYQVQVSTGS